MFKVRQKDQLNQLGGTILQKITAEPEPKEDIIQNPPVLQRYIV